MKAVVVVICCVLALSLFVNAVSSEKFFCGIDICSERGYVACLTPPEVDDPVCLPCAVKRSKCGTTEQMKGCHLFCADILRQNLKEAFHKEQREINSTFSDTQADKDETIKGIHIDLLAMTLLVSILVILIIILVVFIQRKGGFRRRLKPGNIQNDDKERRFDDNDIERNAQDETSRMLPFPARGVGTCEADTQTESTEHECPVARKLNNVNPTDANHNGQVACNSARVYSPSNGNVCRG